MPGKLVKRIIPLPLIHGPKGLPAEKAMVRLSPSPWRKPGKGGLPEEAKRLSIG